MEATWYTKKRLANTEVQKSILVDQDKKDETIGDEFESYLSNVKQRRKCSSLKISNDIKDNPRNKGKTNVYSNKSFKTWKFGTINIRSGKEKDEGSKIYCIAKQVAKLNLTFCCLQEVKYRGIGSKLIVLDSGEKYQYFWCGMKKNFWKWIILKFQFGNQWQLE